MKTIHSTGFMAMTRSAILVSLFAIMSNAAAFSSVTVYGDSLSDNGNLFAATGYPPAPYYDGRRSNGLVSVEYLANSFGAPLVDLAWIGATSGIGNYADGGTVTNSGLFGLPGMTSVFSATNAFLGTIVGPLDASYLTTGLFVVWGGPNDYLAPSSLDATPDAIVDRAVNNEMAIVTGLLSLGVTNILVPGMPDLGLTPYFRDLGLGYAAAATDFTDKFNTELEASLDALSQEVFYYDTAALFRSVVADPASYGFTNVTGYCDSQSTCDGYLFFDDFHPTTAAHELLARQFENVVTVPEPSTITLFALAIIGLSFSRRYRPM